MFALWPSGRYGDILGQTHRILLKKKLLNYFIIILNILNPKESFYNKCHMSSLRMSQKLFVYLHWSFLGAK
jgi:hypothetical protein